DVSDNLGIATEAFQALQFQAEQSGVKSEQFAAALAKTKQSVVEAIDGNRTLANAFEALGLQPETLVGLSLEDQYAAIAHGFASATAQARAFNAISKIFGEDTGPRLAGSLRELAEQGLPAVTQQAREAGRVMNQETVAAL